MKNSLNKLLLFTLMVLFIQCSKLSKSSLSSMETFKRVCYLRIEPNFPFESFIRLNLCTHLIIGFITIDSEPKKLRIDPITDQFLKRCRKSIKHHDPNVKLMFSIGDVKEIGWSMATSTEHKRKLLIESIMKFIRANDLDGVDLDWEFPAFPQAITKSTERQYFTNLLKDIREEFDRYELLNGKHLILSTAVAGQFVIIHASYQPSEMAKYVDFINLMTYDFYIHKWYWPFIGHNSALHARTLDVGPLKKFNTAWAANYWHKMGVPKHQIMVGIPTYGKRYILYSTISKFPGTIAYKGENDMNYTEVCEFLHRPGTIKQFDSEAQVPYAHNGLEWISYENEFSAMHKIHWIHRNNFGGTMLFSLNADDFKFKCGNTIFPIHSTVRDTLLGLNLKTF